jgi:hypothetical protein
MAMPRKPASDNIVPLRTARKRPSPPDRMTASESSIWRALVDAAPGQWFDPAAQVLLRQVVAQVTAADRHVRRLRQRAVKGAPLEAVLAVEKAHRDAMKAVITGMTALRVTPRSHVELRAARSAFAHAPSPGLKPRDIEAEAEEVEEAEAATGAVLGAAAPEGAGDEEADSSA